MAALWVLPPTVCFPFISRVGVGAGWWLPGQDRRGPSVQIKMNLGRAASGSLCIISSELPDRGQECPPSSERRDGRENGRTLTIPEHTTTAVSALNHFNETISDITANINIQPNQTLWSYKTWARSINLYLSKVWINYSVPQKPFQKLPQMSQLLPRSTSMVIMMIMKDFIIYTLCVYL